jgi:hypothetical protein
VKSIIIATLLSAVVWPGAGQLYNRDFKKGAVLIALTFLAGVSLFLAAGMEIARSLPPDLAQVDAVRARMIAEEIAQRNAGFFTAFNLLILATWLFGVVDAFLGARERQNPPPPEPEAEAGS